MDPEVPGADEAHGHEADEASRRKADEAEAREADEASRGKGAGVFALEPVSAGRLVPALCPSALMDLGAPEADEACMKPVSAGRLVPALCPSARMDLGAPEADEASVEPVSAERLVPGSVGVAVDEGDDAA